MTVVAGSSEAVQCRNQLIVVGKLYRGTIDPHITFLQGTNIDILKFIDKLRSDKRSCAACQRKARDCIKPERQIEECCAEYCEKLESRLRRVEADLTNNVLKDEVRDVVRAELAVSNNNKLQQEDLKKVTMAIAEHKKYLESLEAQKRASNMIVPGIPETETVVDGVGLSSDSEKCAAVLRAIGEDSSIIKAVSRLGKAPASSAEGRPRIIKVQLESSECRARILGNSNTLKDAGLPFSRVYIQKDTHPLVNPEF